MPIYEYQCEQCSHKLEKIQKFSDEPLKICPACEKPALKKLVSAAAFRLKGGGWYETDFKTGKKKNVAGSDTPTTSGSTASSDSGSSGAGSSNSSSSSSSGSSGASSGSSGSSSKVSTT